MSKYLIVILLALVLSSLAIKPVMAQDGASGPAPPPAATEEQQAVKADPATNGEAYDNLLYLPSLSNDTYPRMVVLERETKLYWEFCWYGDCGPNEITLSKGAWLYVLGGWEVLWPIPGATWGWKVQIVGNDHIFYTPARTW